MTRIKIITLLILLPAILIPTTSIAAPSTNDDAVLTVEETADLLRMADDKVIELAESGSLPARRIGEEWRFNRAAIMQWL